MLQWQNPETFYDRVSTRVESWHDMSVLTSIAWLPGAERFSPFLGSVPRPDVLGPAEHEPPPSLLMFHCGVMNSVTGHPSQEDSHSPFMTPPPPPLYSGNVSSKPSEMLRSFSGFISAQQNWSIESLGWLKKAGVKFLNVTVCHWHRVIKDIVVRHIIEHFNQPCPDPLCYRSVVSVSQ